MKLAIENAPSTVKFTSPDIIKLEKEIKLLREALCSLGADVEQILNPNSGFIIIDGQSEQAKESK
jgi:hypothetical protein